MSRRGGTLTRPTLVRERTGQGHREAARRIVTVADLPETQCVESRAHIGVWIETVACTAVASVESSRGRVAPS